MGDFRVGGDRDIGVVYIVTIRDKPKIGGYMGIMFKAYNKKTGEIRDVTCFQLDDRYGFVPIDNTIEGLTGEKSDYELMINTGICDKDGQEIYTGHKVEFVHEKSGNLTEWDVVYMGCRFQVTKQRETWKVDNEHVYYYGDQDIPKDCKIIGITWQI